MGRVESCSTRPAANKPLARSRKSNAKRDAIIAAAIKVVNNKSYALATMTEIAASIELRDATLYYYFSSKQALVYACHIRSLERFERLLDETEAKTASGAAKLEQFIAALLQDSERNGPQIYFGDYSYLDAAQREHIGEWAAQLTLRLENFLVDGIADGSVVPCETRLVVQLLIGMLVWLAKWVPSIEQMTAGRLMKAIGAFSLHGLESRTVAAN